MTRININIYPKEGYFFLENDGTRIGGTSWSGVIARVKDYRRRNSLPAGTPDVEVHEQACKRNASLCSNVDAATIAQRMKVSMKGRMLGWLNFLRKKRGSEVILFVDSEAAKRRATICAACPMNTPLKEGCGSCRAALAEIRRDMLGPRQVDARLHGCLVSGEDVAVAAHLETPNIEMPTAPDSCWRKRTL
jgi:hypothetical protein